MGHICAPFYCMPDSMFALAGGGRWLFVAGLIYNADIFVFFADSRTEMVLHYKQALAHFDYSIFRGFHNLYLERGKLASDCLL